MNTVQYLDQPELKPFKQRYKLGEFLFREGEVADAMYLLLDGSVKLLGGDSENPYVAQVVHKGQFLGERALFNSNPVTRYFSAEAKTHVIALKFSTPDLTTLEKASPQLFIEMMKDIIRESARRLESSNALASLLRSTENSERFVRLTHHLFQFFGAQTVEGKELILTTETYASYIDLKASEIEAYFKILLDEKLIVKKVNDTYVVPSETRLLDFAPQLKTKIQSPTETIASTRTKFQLFKRAK